jgi:ribonuclease III
MINNQNIENFIIYTINCKNKLITYDFVNNLLKKFNLNYEINNIDYFIIATTHKTYSLNLSDEEYEIYKNKFTKDNNCIFLQNNNYEKFEFLGDSILKPIMTEYIMEFYPDENEGFLSKLRSRLEKTQMLSKISRSLKISDYVLISREYEENSTRNNNDNIMEDIFEAFIGALYKDLRENNNEGYAFQIIHDLIFNIFEDDEYGIDLQELAQDDNYKDQLNAFCNSHKLPTPKYILKNIEEETRIRGNSLYNVKIYNIYVQIQSFKELGCDENKKEAEQKAAKRMLFYLKNQNN